MHLATQDAHLLNILGFETNKNVVIDAENQSFKEFPRFENN
jgi:hypothetical protein